MKGTVTHRKSGFTLIELLVVIAIIAILAAILFPVFARARENARRASCQSNLKQLMLGVFQYSQDYDEKFIPLRNGTGYWNEIVQPYMKSKQILFCPSLPNANTASDRTFGYNPTLSLQLGNTGTTDFDGIAMASINSTADLITLGDNNLEPKPNQCKGWGGTGTFTGGYYSMWFDPKADSGYPCPVANGGSVGFNAGPDTRHLDTAVVAFADGHVKAMNYGKLYGVPPVPNEGVNTRWPLWYAQAPAQ